MCGLLSAQSVLSGELAARNPLVPPPEPLPGLLLSKPSESVYFGNTRLFRVPFFWNPEKLLNPHICAVGITGSGKSYFVKTFITRARIVLGCSALILDWAGEYSDWVRSAGGKVVSLGSRGINLLDTAGAAPVARIQQVLSALQMLTDISLFPSQLAMTEEAIERAYSMSRIPLNRPYRGKSAPTLRTVLRILEKSAKKARSGDSVCAARRLRNLLFYSEESFCGKSMRLGELLSGLVCIDLHSLPDESLRSLAGLSILQFVKEKMRQRQFCESRTPKLFVVVDEAWKIAADGRSDVVSIVREGRKYGFGLIVASQNPTDVHKSIFSSAGTVLSFRLTLSSEREYVRLSLGHSNFYEELSHSLSVGQALVHLEFSKPVSCPRDFIVGRIEGEEPLRILRIRGGGMGMEFEKGELGQRLLNFGLNDRQVFITMSEFEKHSGVLEAVRFAALLGKFGYGRAPIISLLRELGASEPELLALFSSSAQKGRGEEIDVVLEAPGCAGKVEKSEGPIQRRNRRVSFMERKK